jgi:nucleoside-diphosphate-sugar epimerase
MPDKKRILITGAAGRIATMVREALATGDYEISGIDMRPAEGMECLVANMTDLAAIEPAYRGIDTVVDFANDPAGNLPWEKAHQNNIAATYNSLQAAQKAGVRRFIYTSSNRITEGYQLDHPYSAICKGDYSGLEPATLPLINTSMPPRPNGPYGIAKACAEAAARYFCDYFGMSAICLRLGTMGRDDAGPRDQRQFATLLTPRDVKHLYQCAVAAPDDLKWGVFYGVSNNKWKFWDISDAAKLIGYQPQDNMEDFRGKVESEWGARPATAQAR